MAWPIDYNLRIVLIGTALLGSACGMIGVFLLLRKRALVGDAISHATLPGVCMAYLLGYYFGWKDKSLSWLLMGAAATGILGAITIVALRKWTKLKEDASLGIVLSVYFGIGTALLRTIQTLQHGNAAGLEGFIYGKTALMIDEDAIGIAIAAFTTCAIVLILQKELKLLCFDSGYARSQGWPIVLLDLILMGCVVAVVVVGLQAVGSILVIALLVVPAASARLWTHQFSPMLWISALLGGSSCIAGAYASATMERIPSGAAIVLASMLLFFFSLFFGRVGGVWWRYYSLLASHSRTDEDHLLRGIFELLEANDSNPSQAGTTQTLDVDPSALVSLRNWRPSRLFSTIHRLKKKNAIVGDGRRRIALTARGIRLAKDSVRKHRLLELYFQRQAELTGEAVDRGADLIEHDVDEQILALLEREFPLEAEIPMSIHPLPREGWKRSDVPNQGGPRG